jgi:isocitrate dehydrogenase (NAD+)
MQKLTILGSSDLARYFRLLYLLRNGTTTAESALDLLCKEIPMVRKAVVIPGDGIGPEITEAVFSVLEAAKAGIEWIPCKAGLAALADGDDVLPEITLEEIRRHGIALKGPCTTPVGEGFASVNVQLRKALVLYAAVRPVRNLPGVKTRFDGVDLFIIRENTEGLYSGIENEVTPGVVTSMKVATEKGCDRIARWAFRYATRRQREKITVFHKANIMKLTDGLFLRKAEEVHKNEYPNIAYETEIIDAGCMHLVQDPTQFDILLLENLYGDVVSDLCAGLVGGLGIVPGANYGDDTAIFEAVHGSAPDIAGKNIANPLALLMSAVMMLNYLAESEDNQGAATAAELIRQAYDLALRDGQKTRDLGGTLSTDEFAKAVIERL